MAESTVSTPNPKVAALAAATPATPTALAASPLRSKDVLLPLARCCTPPSPWFSSPG